MRKLVLLALAMVFPLVTVNAAELGVYYCVIERMVGMQAEGELGADEDPFDVPRVAGVVVPAVPRFVLKISEFSAETDDFCIGLKSREEAGLGEPRFFWPNCEPRAKYKAELSSDFLLNYGVLDPMRLVSLFGDVFYNRAVRFDLYGEKFRMVGFGPETSYLSEGICNRFEQ